MNNIDLQNKIDIFKKNFLNKERHLVYKQNNFDLFLDKIVIKIIEIIKIALNNKKIMIIKAKVLKSINTLIETIFAKKTFSLNKRNFDNLKIEKLDKKIDTQYQSLQKTLLDNSIKLKKEISDLNLKIDEKLKNNIFKSAENLGHNSSSRVDFLSRRKSKIRRGIDGN